jgi:hypothetical protein
LSLHSETELLLGEVGSRETGTKLLENSQLCLNLTTFLVMAHLGRVRQAKGAVRSACGQPWVSVFHESEECMVNVSGVK